MASASRKSYLVYTTDVEGLAGEEDDFVKLREIGEKVVDTRSFGCSPSSCALNRFNCLSSKGDETILTSQDDDTSRPSRSTSRV